MKRRRLPKRMRHAPGLQPGTLISVVGIIVVCLIILMIWLA